MFANVQVYALTGGLAPLMPSIDSSHSKKRPPSDEKVGHSGYKWFALKDLRVRSLFRFMFFLQILKIFMQITWQWLSFTNSARKDNLQLYHWVYFEPAENDYMF